MSKIFFIYGDYIVQGEHRQALMGMMYSIILGDYVEDDKVSISFGTFYRWDDTQIPKKKLEYHRLGIVLCYDANIYKLSAASHYRGAFELTVSFKSFINIRNSSRD